MEVVGVFVDGKPAGSVEVPRGADERALAKAAAGLADAAAVIRSGAVHETIRRAGKYELLTGRQPLTPEEAARIPGAQFVLHPFLGI